MTWTYGGDPSVSDRDRVRFLIGDTDEADPLLSDEEIAYLLDARGTAESAAPHACVAIVAKLSREVDYTIGPEKVEASQRLENYNKLIKSLKDMWVGVNAAPVWQAPNSKTSGSLFDVGMHDNGKGDDPRNG